MGKTTAKTRKTYESSKSKLRRVHPSKCDVPGGGRVLEPKASHTGTLIYLHHWISSAAEYVGSRRYFFDRLSGVRVVLPQAPKRKSKWYGYNTPLWFDYVIGSEETPDPSSLDEGAERLIEVVKAEVQRVGDAERVWLGGESQGAPAAFHALMDERMPKIGGFVGTSGTIDANTKPDGAKSSMPIRFFIPGKDDVYPKTRTVKRIREFRRAGFTNLKGTIIPRAVHADNAAANWIKTFVEEMQQRFSEISQA
jgi:predicted esterase